MQAQHSKLVVVLALALCAVRLTGSAGPASDSLPLDLVRTGRPTPAPVPNAAFSPGPDATAALPFSGTVRIAQSAMQTKPVLPIPIVDGRDARLFPAVALSFFTIGDVLVPVERGRMVKETLPATTGRVGTTGKSGATGTAPSYWRVIPQFGRVWRETADGDWSRAAFPIMLVNDTENHAHQGLATFLYKTGATTDLRFQFVQHTGPYSLKAHFVAWGSARATLAARSPGDLDARRAEANAELADRLPAQPWSDLVKSVPPGTLDGFGGPLDPRWMVEAALVKDGVLYYQSSPTPYGDYPYPLEMRFGVRSATKSVAAPLSLLRLAQVYGPWVLTLKVGDYIKGLDPKWNRVRFLDAANMATGFGGVGSLVTNPNGVGDSGLHGTVLRIDPDVPAIPSLLGFGINPTSTTAGGSVRGTVGLVTPAPPGGATISLSSDNPAAQVPSSVNIAAGNSATTFTVGTSAVGSFTSATITGSSGASTKQAFLDIFPDPNAGPQLASVTPGVMSAPGGSSVTATVTLTGAAPSGGASVTMATSSTKAQAPPIVTVPAGQTSATFTITTSTVTQNTLVTVTGTFGNGSKSGSFTLTPAAGGDTTAPVATITSPAAGATVSGTISIQANASDNVGVTRVDFLVDGAVLSSDTTSPYSASWNTTGAANGTHALTVRAFDAANNQKTSAAVSVTVNNGTTAAPTLTLSGVPTSIRRGQTFTATATVTNSGAVAASGFSVRVSFTPSNSLRLQNPTSTTQSVPTVAPGGSQSVAWQMRADNAGTATLTMTLRDAGGATVRTVSQTITITN